MRTLFLFLAIFYSVVIYSQNDTINISEKDLRGSWISFDYSHLRNKDLDEISNSDSLFLNAEYFNFERIEKYDDADTSCIMLNLQKNKIFDFCSNIQKGKLYKNSIDSIPIMDIIVVGCYPTGYNNIWNYDKTNNRIQFFILPEHKISTEFFEKYSKEKIISEIEEENNKKVKYVEYKIIYIDKYSLKLKRN